MENEELIVEAVKITDGREYDTSGAREIDVAREVINLRRMLSKNSTPMRALVATPLVVRITNIELEESSNRYLVSFVDLRSDEGKVEHVRSDRLDSSAGAAVKKLWEDKVGKNVRLYKYLEPTKDSDKPSVRIAPYVELL